jgi:predicted metal-dependent enzyme (double-stranded beta helix superfamily)
MIEINSADPNLRIIGRDPVPPALRRFIWDIQSMVELAESEREILLIGRDLMARLFTTDDWLPTVFAVPNPAGGQQFQIYHDVLDRFSVASTILSGGACMTISQPSVWEIAGVLRGAINRQQLDGSPTNSAQVGASRLLQANAVEAARSSASGEVFELRNALDDRTSIIIHVYGGDIGQISRRSGASGGSVDAPPLGYANSDDDPPYDIFSIQHEVRD